MRKRIVLIVLLAIPILSLAAVSGTTGTTDASEYRISISGSLDGPNQTLTLSGTEFNISETKAINPGEGFTADLDVPSEDTEYSVEFRDVDSNIYDAEFLTGDAEISLYTGSEPGTYFVSLINDTVRDIYRVIIEGYDVRVDDIPESTKEDSTVRINATVAEKSENDQEFTGVDLVIWNDTISRNVNLSESGGNIATKVPLDGLSPGTYFLYLVARGNETVSGQNTPIGFSSTQTLEITSPKANSLDNIGLASDIRGPIEYRGDNQYKVAVAFDRRLNDTSDLDVRVTGTNPDGNAIDTGNLSVLSGSVGISDGVAGDGSGLNNSVLTIDLGSASDSTNNLVTDGNLEVRYNGSLIGEFDVIETSTQIDAGNPADAVVYEGERVAVYNLTDGHDRYEIFEGGSFQFSGQSGDNTTVAFEDTGDSDITTGNDYRFDFLNSSLISRTVTGNATLDVRDLGLDITLNREGESQTSVNLTATITSNVAARSVQVDLLKDDASINSKTINLRGDGADREAAVTFTNISVETESSYTVRAIDLETGIQYSQEATTTLKGAQKFAYELTLLNGTTHALAFPGPVNGTYGDMFGGINGTVWTYDASTETWRHPEASETISALDAAFVIPEERATVTIDFADSESGPKAPGEKAVYEGWNFIGAPQYSGAESAFTATTASPRRILQVGAQPFNQPFPRGDSFGWYTFGGDATAPRVSAFSGYWVFMAENGTVGANLYRGVTREEAEDLLTGGGS